VQFAGRPVERDVAAGSWIAGAVRPFATGVGSLLPPVFDAYARVFHPAARYVGDKDVDVTWAEVAAANGKTAHPVMEWGSITGSMEFFHSDDQDPLWHGAPAMGHLPEAAAARTAAVLARHTTTPDECWFGIWNGWGALVADGPTLVLRGREYWLVRGPIRLAAENMAPEPSEQSASLWWPDDRAWCVATDIDLVTTYVGGSSGCIADLLATEGLETAPAHAAQRVTWDADRLNPLPADAPSGSDG
jgi:hypothetical protein